MSHAAKAIKISFSFLIQLCSYTWNPSIYEAETGESHFQGQLVFTKQRVDLQLIGEVLVKHTQNPRCGFSTTKQSQKQSNKKKHFPCLITCQCMQLKGKPSSLLYNPGIQMPLQIHQAYRTLATSRSMPLMVNSFCFLQIKRSGSALEGVSSHFSQQESVQGVLGILESVHRWR